MRPAVGAFRWACRTGRANQRRHASRRPDAVVKLRPRRWSVRGSPDAPPPPPPPTNHVGGIDSVESDRLLGFLFCLFVGRLVLFVERLFVRIHRRLTVDDESDNGEPEAVADMEASQIDVKMPGHECLADDVSPGQVVFFV